MKFRLAALALAALAHSPAHASIHGGGGLVACPKGVFLNADGVSDGCPLAGLNGSWKMANLASVSAQSGQTYVDTTPWNRAGIDYPVGYDTTLTLKDPAVTQPPGCTYQTTGRGGIISVGTPFLQCTSAFVVNGYDMSLHGGVVLQVEQGFSGACVVLNSKFVRGSAIHADVLKPSLITFNTGSGCTVDIEHNEFDGGYNAGYYEDVSLINDVTTGGGVYQYNVFHEAAARAHTGGSGGCPSYTWRYNAEYRTVMVPYGDDHGEMWTDYVLTQTCTLDHIYSDFNTNSISAALTTNPYGVATASGSSNTLTLTFGPFTAPATFGLAAGNEVLISGLSVSACNTYLTVQTADATHATFTCAGAGGVTGTPTYKTQGAWSSPFFDSPQANLFTTVTNLTNNNNTLYGNLFGGVSTGDRNGATTAQAIASLGFWKINNLEIKDNHVDCTGMLVTPIQNGGSWYGYSGSIVSNVLTITGIPSGSTGALLPGALITQGGVFTPRKILSQTSGTTGAAGTYTVSAGVGVGSFASANSMPNLVSTTISGNVNMATGNPVTATGIDLSGACT